MSTRSWLVLLTAFLLLLISPAVSAAEPPGGLDCDVMDCPGVLPGAVSFEEPPADGAYRVGKDAAGEVVGWVALSTDIVDIKAYSGKPLVTLVGLTPDGLISGAQVIHHSEPILLVGIPEQELHDFVTFYAGKPATANVAVGSSPDPEALTVDMISGATVTVLAQNQTILDTARTIGGSVGVVDLGSASVGHWVEEENPWTWKQLVEGEALGHMRVTEADMGKPGDRGVFLELWFTLADPPQVGKSLIPKGDYDHIVKNLGPEEHLLVVAGRGSNSFKGSGFVRGGIFDRIKLDQGMNSVMFRDTDYFNLPDVMAKGAPEFKEGAVFIIRDGKIDPGAPFSLTFTGSRYDGKGAFSREFHSFDATLQMPPSIYVVEQAAQTHEPPSMQAQAWYNQRFKLFVLGFILVGTAGLFLSRKFLTGSMKRLVRLHVGVMLVSLFVLGFWLKAQPSVTQVLTLIDSIVREWSWDLFLMEPLLFIFWIFIAVIIVVWGRGVFCGWLCPYGSLSELLFKLGRTLKLPHLDLPNKIHRWLKYLRYLILLVLVAAYLYSPELGETMAEIEPFKTTFFVRPWEREWIFVVWWLVLLAPAMVVFRPFCRYVCPLGAALALPSSIRRFGPHRRQFCASCTICTRGCEPLAIDGQGRIDARECLSCMECEANYRDEQVCPPLVGIARLTAGQKATATSKNSEDRLAKLRRSAEDR
jgi:NosR/NirI family nitrous oxide reductase transcriptional regulator